MLSVVVGQTRRGKHVLIVVVDRIPHFLLVRKESLSFVMSLVLASLVRGYWLGQMTTYDK